MKTIRKKIKTNVIFSNECFVKCQVFFCLPNSYSIERIQRIHARIDIELKVFFTENSKKKNCNALTSNLNLKLPSADPIIPEMLSDIKLDNMYTCVCVLKKEEVYVSHLFQYAHKQLINMMLDAA